MANKKISELTNLNNPNLSAITPVVTNNITYKTSLQNLRQVLVDSGSHTFTGSQRINGNLIVSGSLTAQEYIISSSYINIVTENISGSTSFGNSSDDTHKFTGSVFIDGNLNIKSIDNNQEYLLDIGVNSPISNSNYVGNENDAFLVNTGNDFYIGTKSTDNFQSRVHLFTDNNWENSQIILNPTKEISFNTSSVTSGFTYEFSGSVKLQNELNVIGSVTSSYFVGDGSQLTNLNFDGLVTTGSNFFYGDQTVYGNLETDFYLITQYVAAPTSSQQVIITGDINKDTLIGVYAGEGIELILFEVEDSIWEFQKGGIMKFPDGTYQNTSFTTSSIAGFATTGSNTFIGNQTISGSVQLQNELNINGSVTASFFVGDGSLLTNLPPISNYVEGTYDEIYSLYTGSTLVPGTFYLMTDYQTCYDQPNYDNLRNAIVTNNYMTGSTEPILLLATSISGFSSTVYSTMYPEDKISYDITWNITEITNSPAKGRITERIDNFNNRTDYDHRTILFKRYNGYSYEENQPLSGLIGVSGITGTTAVLYGNTGTTFNTNFSIGSILAIQSLYPKFFEIISVESDYLAIISGVTIGEVFDSPYFSAFNDGIMSYYQPNIRQNEVFEYTTFGDAIVETGAVNNYIGDYSNLHLERGIGDFILANNVFINGSFVNNTIGNGSYNNTFNDDCDNNQIGDSFFNNSTNDDFDGNIIGEGFNNNYITSNFNNNRIGSDFNNNILIGGSFYRNNIGNNFEYNVWVNGDFQNNEIGNQFNQNNIYAVFYNNDIGNGYNGNNTYSDYYRNLIGNGFNGNTIYSQFYENNIGHVFVGNTIGLSSNIGGYNFKGNNIGNYFQTNTIRYEFQNNTILNNFYNNSVYFNVHKNSILNGFEGNTIGGIDNINQLFENNQIMNVFKGNNIQGNFWSNQIKSNFKSNEIYNEFGYNNVGYSFFVNTLSGSTNYNIIGDYFEFNTLYGSFAHNTIGTNFYSNEVQDGFGFGGGSYRGNIIGNNFYDNNIGEYFYDNTIGDNFTNNTVVDYFQLNRVCNNVISNNFSGATHVYGYYNCEIFTNSAGSLRLSYYDSSDVLNITNITA